MSVDSKYFPEDSGQYKGRDWEVLSYNHYGILGLAPTDPSLVEQESIKKAMVGLARVYHADKGVGEGLYMQQINLSYNVLKDSFKKEIFDSHYMKYLQEKSLNTRKRTRSSTTQKDNATRDKSEDVHTIVEVSSFDTEFDTALFSVSLLSYVQSLEKLSTGVHSLGSVILSNSMNGSEFCEALARESLIVSDSTVILIAVKVSVGTTAGKHELQHEQIITSTAELQKYGVIEMDKSAEKPIPT